MMSDVGIKSSGDEADDIDLSSLLTSSSVTSVNIDNESPLNDWSDDSGLNCWFVSAVKMAILMLRNLLTKNTASMEQKDTSASVDWVATSQWLVNSRSLTVDQTQSLSLPASWDNCRSAHLVIHTQYCYKTLRSWKCKKHQLPKRCLKITSILPDIVQWVTMSQGKISRQRLYSSGR